jgi:hypothetical protein
MAPVCVATAAEIQLGIDRQNRVIDALTEILTNDRISSDDLHHFAVVRYAFKPQFDATLSRLVDCEFGHPELARGLLVGLLLHTVERLISPQPDAVEVRQPRKKAPVKPIPKATQKWRERIARMTPAELAAFRERERLRLKSYHRRTKARLVPSA